MREGFGTRAQLVPFFFFFLLQALFWVRRADVIHCHWTPAGIVGTIAGKYFWRRPVVLMMHHGYTRLSHAHRRMLKWILRNVDCLLANSSFTLNMTLLVAKPKRYDVIPPGIDTTQFRARERTCSFYEEIGFRSDAPLLLAIGRFIPCKGFYYLIEAMAILVRDPGLPHVQLLMAGNGPLRTELEQTVLDRNLEGNIRFVDSIPRERMPLALSHADILVAPSIVDDQGNTEGLGLTLIEANACGVPCIGSRVGGIADVIEDGQNGLLVEEKKPAQIAEKIRHLLLDPRRRMEMGEAGQRMVQRKYDSRVTTKSLINLYRQMQEDRGVCGGGTLPLV